MSYQGTDAHAKCSKEITTLFYARERMDPRLGDSLYLVLSDLKMALDAHKTSSEIKVVDFGCGCSPYRQMFPSADYKRADFLDTGDLDYLLGLDGKVKEESDTFDLVLSAQVLEHIPEPGVYLKECFRLLKPGGKLVISTHGSFEDHPCPVDCWRWTHQGLKQELVDAGFCDIDMKKLTTDMRAVIFLFQRFCDRIDSSSRSFTGLLLRALSRLGKVRKKSFDRACDHLFADSRVVDVDPESRKHNFYIVLFATAVKPI